MLWLKYQQCMEVDAVSRLKGLSFQGQHSVGRARSNQTDTVRQRWVCLLHVQVLCVALRTSFLQA